MRLAVSHATPAAAGRELSSFNYTLTTWVYYKGVRVYVCVCMCVWQKRKGRYVQLVCPPTNKLLFRRTLRAAPVGLICPAVWQNISQPPSTLINRETKTLCEELCSCTCVRLFIFFFSLPFGSLMFHVTQRPTKVPPKLA